MSLFYVSLKLALVIGSAFFGAFALLTKYKDDAGRITRSGKIALCGIVGTAVISVMLYAMDIRTASDAAKKARADADAAAQRLLMPLGPMRLRIRVKVPAAQIAPYRDRILSHYSGWNNRYPMPLTTDRDVPQNSTAEAQASNFFSLIMIACSVDDSMQDSAHPTHRPEFGKLVIYGLPHPNVLEVGQGARQVKADEVNLSYSYSEDVFYLELRTPYFDDYDASGKFLSFRDFAGKSLRLAFNIRERFSISVPFVEIEAHNGKRRIFIEHFTETAPGSDTFTAAILPKAFSD